MQQALCCLALFLGRHEQMSTHSTQELMAEQIMDTTKVQLCGPMSSVGVTYRNRDEQMSTHSRKETDGR